MILILYRFPIPNDHLPHGITARNTAVFIAVLQNSLKVSQNSFTKIKVFPCIIHGKVCSHTSSCNAVNFYH